MLTKDQLYELINQMHLDEKIGMLHGNGVFETKGVDRLNIPPLTMSDGPMGVRQEFPKASWIAIGNTNDYVTYFPANTALAATWNPELSYTFGQALGAESRSRGKDVILAPGINIIRSPLCGRNFEYMSEDPYLTGIMAAPIIKGIQEKDVAACVKHFALNNQETDRLEVNVEVEQRALEEIYLPAFEMCLAQEKSLTVMAAYNKFRGHYCCESTYLLNDILRQRYDYDGVVISDWSACHSTEASALAGLDIEMSVTTDFDHYYMGLPLRDAVKEKVISMNVVDEKVYRILTVMNQLNMLDGTRQKGERNTLEHQKASLKVAEESIVLLENSHNFLPLDPVAYQRIAIVGENANKAHSQGGGSAEIKALYEHTPYAGLEMYLGGNTKITYVRGYSSDKDATSDMQFNLRMEAERIASQNDLVIFIGGLNHDHDTEGKDRTNYGLPYEQDKLIQALYKVNKAMVVINISGSAVDLSTAKACSQALIHTWYNGMEGGRALAQVLFGEINPSGKLPFTFAKNLEDYASHSIGEFPGGATVHYSESIFVGYRHFDSNKIDVLYPFGHGLSYTDFAYRDLSIEQTGDLVNVSLQISNTGNYDGSEVVQLYVYDNECSEPRPSKELKGFKKVMLSPNESKTVTFELAKKAFAFFSEKTGDWLNEPGIFTVMIGSSVSDIRVSEKIDIK